APPAAIARRGRVSWIVTTPDSGEWLPCGWIIDYDHPSRNDDFLFWEFAYLC
ncbi:MAG: hypothetical protein RIS94_2209, partial [Pseudomonadota bacterium]